MTDIAEHQSTGLIMTMLNRDHRAVRTRTRTIKNPQQLLPPTVNALLEGSISGPPMIPINAKQTPSASAPASRRTVLLAQGRSLTIRVALTPAADSREGSDGRASHRPRSRAGTRKAGVTSRQEVGGVAAPGAGIAKDGAARSRRRQGGRRWKRKAARTAAVEVAAAAAAAAAARPATACAGAPTACAGAACAAAASPPPLDDLLCELRGLCL